MTSTYITIGNSDDKLTQREWATYFSAVAVAIQRASQAAGGIVHGQWVSEPASAWQNACWCVSINADSAGLLKLRLSEIAAGFRQDSIAWAEAPKVEFLPGVSP
jgi:hypothetical protein